MPLCLAPSIELACVVRVAARGKYDRALLLDLGIGQRPGEAGDREIRRRRAIDDRRNDTGPQEGSEQTDVPFALGLPFDNFGEGGNAAEPDIDGSASKRTGSALSRERYGSRVRLKPRAIWGMSVYGSLRNCAHRRLRRHGEAVDRTVFESITTVDLALMAEN
jgi:hypothetical protein